MGVAVLGDEVLVCEDHNECTIMVYDRKDFKYLRRTVRKESGTLTRTSTDIHSNIYATDISNHMVSVCNRYGAFLQFLGCDHKGVRMLNKPNSICVSGQFVYITNSGGCYVLVFTTTGDYVTSFGRDDNEFSHLSGNTVDSNNFIFITDSYGIVYQL